MSPHVKCREAGFQERLMILRINLMLKLMILSDNLVKRSIYVLLPEYLAETASTENATLQH